ncbi:MAG: adenosylcobinamide-phosphate synthase CbiB [Hyphomicrobium sp.]
MTFAGAMAVAMMVDAIFGWPRPLFDRIGHPVTWLGALIARLDATLNRDADSADRRRLSGIFASMLVILLAVAIGATVQLLLPSGWSGTLLIGLLAWPYLALKSMYDHVADVAEPLVNGDLAGAREAVAMIVGRDPSALDDAGVARAAIESLAENTSDGIVAPLFWGVLLGLPGIAGYKAVNTLDSMIGHRTPRHEAFGWAAARIDDVANLVPARMTGVLFALVSSRPAAALQCMMRDARHHRSPNAGWPEAAMAGALSVRLSGPRVYGESIAEEPWLNAGAPDPAAADVAHALNVYVRAMFFLCACLAAVVLL